MEENFEILDERDGHRLRLRERIERGGFDRIPPHQILEFLLCYAIPRQDVDDLAHAMLNHFGDLRTVLHASLEELSMVEGLGGSALKWMNLVNTSIACCEGINKLPSVKIKNFAHAFRAASAIRGMYPGFNFLQLCINAAGEVVYYLPLEAENGWADPPVLREALRNAVLVHPESVLIFAFMDEIALPDGDQLERVQDYADTLSQARSGLADVILVDTSGMVSLRQQDMITREKKTERLKALLEDYMQGMPAPDEVYCFKIPGPQEEIEEINEPV